MSEYGRHNGNRFKVRRNFRNGSEKSFHGTALDADAVANLEFDCLGHGFNAELLNFSGSQRNGATFGTDKSCGAGDVTDDVPRSIGHDHLDENVAGEYLGFAFLGNAILVRLLDQLRGNLDLVNEVCDSAVLDDLLEVGFYFVFIAGIGMYDIPFSGFCIFAHLHSHPFSLNGADEVDQVLEIVETLAETEVNERKTRTDNDHGNEYDR